MILEQKKQDTCIIKYCTNILKHGGTKQIHCPSAALSSRTANFAADIARFLANACF